MEPFHRKTYLPVGAAVLVLILRFSGVFWFFYLFVGCLLSLFAGTCVAKVETQSLSINNILDTATDRRLDLERSNKALREQQDSEIYAATLRERNRIAREIHDNVGHILSRSILMTGALETINQDETLTQPLAQLESQLSQAMTSIRESVHDLHDDSLDLEQSAGLLLRDFTFCPAALDCSVSHSVPHEVKYCFLAVLKEALTNVARHSNATQVEVHITEHPALYQLVIRDNGTQIRPDALDGLRGEGIGLENMRQRVRSLGGSISFDVQNGFRIFISVPKRRTTCE
jgi:signal transduction histidine kinase